MKTKWSVHKFPDSVFYKSMIKGSGPFGEFIHSYVSLDGNWEPQDLYDVPRNQTNYPITQLPKYILKKAGVK